MSTIYFPTTRPYRPSGMTLTLIDNARVSRSGETASVQVSQRPGARWKLDLEWSNHTPRDAAALQAKIAEGRGRVNVWSMWYFARPLPWGKINGTATISGAVAQGTSQMTIAAGAGSTLENGDMLQLPGQLVLVTGSSGVGTMTVNFEPPARRDWADGQSVEYSYPAGIFRLTGDSGISISHAPGFSPGFSASFIEEP